MGTLGIIPFSPLLLREEEIKGAKNFKELSHTSFYSFSQQLHQAGGWIVVMSIYKCRTYTEAIFWLLPGDNK